MTIGEMKQDKYNPLVLVEAGHYLQFLDSDKNVKHPLLGFVIANPTGMSNGENATKCDVIPVIALNPNDQNFAIFPNETHGDLPF